jgi:hypothetical protein
MLKTYRIIPLVFILFLFGFTLITVAPVFAQTLDQLIERVEKLEDFHAGDTATPSLTQPSSPDTPVVTEPHAKVTDAPWNPSMGMCHNSRPCMKDNKCGKMCNASVRASKGWVKPNDTNNPASQAARANPAVTEPHAKVTDGPWDPSMGMRHPARPCMKNGLINPSKGCGPDNRASAIIARDPYDKEYIILKRAAPALEQACFRSCEANSMDGSTRWTCKARCVDKRPNPRCKGGSFSGFYTTESSLRCLN